MKGKDSTDQGKTKQLRPSWHIRIGYLKKVTDLVETTQSSNYLSICYIYRFYVMRYAN